MRYLDVGFGGVRRCEPGDTIVQSLPMSLRIEQLRRSMMIIVSCTMSTVASSVHLAYYIVCLTHYIGDDHVSTIYI
jgi:hypothetical protein